jgi:hypothetical protein
VPVTAQGSWGKPFTCGLREISLKVAFGIWALGVWHWALGIGHWACGKKLTVARRKLWQELSFGRKTLMAIV